MKNIILAFLLIASPALATEYVRAPNLIATDVCYGQDVNTATSQAYAAAYIAQFGGTQAWLPVAANVGTVQDGATLTVVNGTVTAQVPAPSPPPVYQTLTKAAFQQYAYAALGAVAQPSGTQAQQQLAGITRFGAILLAMKASADPATAAALDAYNNNTTFDLPTVTTFMTIIGPQGSGIATGSEVSAVESLWPNQ